MQGQKADTNRQETNGIKNEQNALKNYKLNSLSKTFSWEKINKFRKIPPKLQGAFLKIE